ncbi:uncharacterized protein At4g04775-like [Mercurialis annua]|uniref:uncharacterized protein At4g04775-like n=1 Tax=Mercurialis annua TaxID=3986 RepID=UPI0021601725|nr:uncharacterized protein At4g04775-like [Mercurialis annua]
MAESIFIESPLLLHSKLSSPPFPSHSSTEPPTPLQELLNNVMEGGDGVVHCDCGSPARVKVSTTEKNPGRRFYTCAGRNNPNCSFFAWVDKDLDGYALMMLTNMKMEVTHLKNERDAALLQAGEVRALLAARILENNSLNGEVAALKEIVDMYKNENQILKEEMGLEMMEVNTLKERIEEVQLHHAKAKKTAKMMKYGICGCGVVTAGAVVYALFR